MRGRSPADRYRRVVLASATAVGLSVGFLVLGAGAHGAPARASGVPSTLINLGRRTTTTVATTTTSAPTTSTTAGPTTTTVPGTPELAGAAFLPCQVKVVASEPCNQVPTELEVTYEASSNTSAVDVVWVPGSGRPSKAPVPAQTSVVLTGAEAITCPGSQGQAGLVTLCWNWPSALTDASGSTTWILNGTYDVDACSGPASAPTCDSTGRPVGLAAPSGAPQAVHTFVTAGTVAISWTAPKSVPPDLVGYEVTRDGVAVYDCSVDGAGPGANVPCQPSLSAIDAPPAGSWSYAVSALRFGVDAASSAVVASSPESGPVANVVAAGSYGGLGGALGGIYLGPLAAVTPGGSLFNLPDGIYPPAESETGPAAAASLPYSGASEEQPATSGARETGPQNSSLDSLASIALGLIALALAVHVWYLRGELKAATVRVTSRRQGPARA